jgi:hypothetical protein
MAIPKCSAQDSQEMCGHRSYRQIPQVSLKNGTGEAWKGTCSIPNSAPPGKRLVPFPDNALTATAVSSYVNNVGNQGPQCLEPA